eukprot:Opistho-2@93494
MLYPSLSACIRDTWLQNRLSVDPLTESQCQFNWTLQGYIAPETLHDGRCSAASDLYGLGVAAHEMYMKACRLVRDETDEWRVFFVSRVSIEERESKGTRCRCAADCAWRTAPTLWRLRYALPSRVDEG